MAIMRTLRHKNIVSLQEVVDDPTGNKMLLVMDYMEGGPVMTREALERGRCIPEPLALQYFRDMCKVGPRLLNLAFLICMCAEASMCVGAPLRVGKESDMGEWTANLWTPNLQDDGSREGAGV